MKKSFWRNIFNNNKMCDYDMNEHYLIKSINDKIELYKIKDNNKWIIKNPSEIIKKENIFLGDKIIVNIFSFKNTHLEIIEKLVNLYKISYIKKILIEDKIEVNKLDDYLTSINCFLYEKHFHTKNLETILVIRDNLGELHNISCLIYDDINNNKKYYYKFNLV